MRWDTMALIGRIVRPHGRHGDVVVASETDFGEERFAPGAQVHVRAADGGTVQTRTVRSSRAFDGRWIVGLDGVGSIDDAETLRDAEIRIPEEALHALEPGAFYVHELVGCRVVTSAGADVGAVERVEFGSGTPLLVVAGRVEVLVPLAAAICRVVDVRAGRIEIDPPEGLIELNAR